MRLPNADQAVVDIVKLRDYCLSVTHPRGRHKARKFSSSLGMSAVDAADLREAILEAVRVSEAVEADADKFGRRFAVDFTLSYRGRTAGIRTAWIVRRGEDFPRLTSCYVM